MNWLNTLFILLTAFLVVFWEAAFHGLGHLLRAQIDFLPPLMVYASLTSGLATVTALAILGGLGFDALSANPLGATVAPLFIVGMGIHLYRDLILRDQFFAQATLGLAASAAVPILTLVLLLTTGHIPLLGWGTLWQLIVMSLGGAIATPILFEVFRFFHHWLGPPRLAESSFRSDREIRRGR